jgi:hypothetical protein
MRLVTIKKQHLGVRLLPGGPVVYQMQLGRRGCPAITWRHIVVIIMLGKSA